MCITCNPIFLEDAKDKLRIVKLMFQVKFEDQIRVTKFEPFELYGTSFKTTEIYFFYFYTVWEKKTNLHSVPIQRI